MEELLREKKNPLRHLFVDLEKAFDRVSRELIQWALSQQNFRKSGTINNVSVHRVQKTRVRQPQGCIDYFESKVGVHQASALSRLLFILVMEKATRNCRSMVPWHMLYADDRVVSAETES